MRLTLAELLKFANENNLGMDTKIKINGGELNYMFAFDGEIYLDETETGEGEEKGEIY